MGRTTFFGPRCILPKCNFPQCVFAKCTRLACFLSFASLFFNINQVDLFKFNQTHDSMIHINIFVQIPKRICQYILREKNVLKNSKPVPLTRGL